MKSVFVCSRAVLQTVIPPNDALVLISIEDPEGKYTDEINLDGWKDSIQLKFHDTLEKHPLDNGKFTTQFDEFHATILLDFILKHEDENFVIHCNAGISRSVAVGVFIKDLLNHELQLFSVHTDAFRNILVYNLLKRELRKRNDDGTENRPC